MTQSLFQAGIKTADFLLPIAFSLWQIGEFLVVPRTRPNHHRYFIIGTKIELVNVLAKTVLLLKLASKPAQTHERLDAEVANPAQHGGSLRLGHLRTKDDVASMFGRHADMAISNL